MWLADTFSNTCIGSLKCSFGTEALVSQTGLLLLREIFDIMISLRTHGHTYMQSSVLRLSCFRSLLHLFWESLSTETTHLPVFSTCICWGEIPSQIQVFSNGLKSRGFLLKHVATVFTARPSHVIAPHQNRWCEDTQIVRLRMCEPSLCADTILV